MSKRIILCFDGTTNHPKDAQQEEKLFAKGELEDNSVTNVFKLHLLLGGDLTNSNEIIPSQHSFYYSGVGTRGNMFRKAFNTMFAPENLEVDKITETALTDLEASYLEDDQIFIFGFSRGAAIARRFACLCQKPIRFVGLFDTVASMGIVNLDKDDKPVSDVCFEDDIISPNIREALHLLSIDENRIAFRPTLMNKEDKVTEIWFPGAHADVGGGFRNDGLSDITLQFMLRQIETRKLGLELLQPYEVDYEKLNEQSSDDEFRIELNDIDIQPNYNGKIHTKDRWGLVEKATLETRKVRINVGDRASSIDIPLVHPSLRLRLLQSPDYHAEALTSVAFQLWGDPGKRIYQGARELTELEPA